MLFRSSVLVKTVVAKDTSIAVDSADVVNPKIGVNVSAKSKDTKYANNISVETDGLFSVADLEYDVETSSMMTRLSSPISTLPMLTLVPSSFSNTPQAIELIHFCTGGVFRDTAMARYNAASDHIVRTNIVLICFKRYSQS